MREDDLYLRKAKWEERYKFTKFLSCTNKDLYIYMEEEYF